MSLVGYVLETTGEKKACCFEDLPICFEKIVETIHCNIESIHIDNTRYPAKLEEPKVSVQGGRSCHFVDALRKNSSLTALHLEENRGLGDINGWKNNNDILSVDATLLKSNHTMWTLPIHLKEKPLSLDGPRSPQTQPHRVTRRCC